MDLKGRYALVTGGSRGIGKAIVDELESREVLLLLTQALRMLIFLMTNQLTDLSIRLRIQNSTYWLITLVYVLTMILLISPMKTSIRSKR